MGVPRLIIITGSAGAGKTTIGKWLAEKLRFPFFNKDGIKEVLYDSLGWSDREWSQKLGAASSELIWYVVHAQLQAGRSLIIESNFSPKFTNPQLQLLKDSYELKVVQILCQADKPILYERFKTRAHSGERHPGHVDHLSLEEAQSTLGKNLMYDLEFCDYTFVVDTNDFEKVDLDGLLSNLQNV